jgi:hypothetical protein
MRENGILDISNPKQKQKYLWRYLDLHKFINLLLDHSLLFSRLDKFDDPFEGVATKLLRKNAEHKEELGQIIATPLNLKSSKLKNKLFVKAVLDKTFADTVAANQKRQFVNCWFAGDRESMAMWNIYSNVDSVAIRVEFAEFKKIIEPAFKKFITENGNRLSILGDEIAYLNLNPFDTKLPKQKLKYSAFKKDTSFQYENEYRFLIVTIDKLEKPETHYKIPLDLTQLNLTFIAHPNMEEWKFENIKKLLKQFLPTGKLERSSTLLKKQNNS